MKRITLFLTLCVFVFLNSSAQKLQELQVTIAAKAAFQKKYPSTSGKWELENGNYEVNFKQDKKSCSAIITKKGEVLETETDITISELPATIQPYIVSHYAADKIKEAAKIVKANGEVNYECEVNGKDVIFDETGKFIKEAKD